jgi:hypothetical protein
MISKSPLKALRFTMTKLWHDVMQSRFDQGFYCTMADCMRDYFHKGLAFMLGDGSMRLELDISMIDHATTLSLSPKDWDILNSYREFYYPREILLYCFYHALKKEKIIKKDGSLHL